MIDPERLLLKEGSDQERRLLQAGAAEQPPADGAARLAQALGISPPLPPAAPSPPSPPLFPGGAAGGLTPLKAALLAGAGAAVALTLTLSSPFPAPSATPARPNEPAPAPDAPVDEQPSPSTADTPAETASSLADEIARLDTARRALAARHPERALGALDAYRAEHPQGTLAPEALRLRVEAWLAKGDLKRAREIARAFLRAYPQSPHAATLRRIAERELNDEAAPRP